MNRQGPVLFEAPLAHEHASHCNCRECRSNFAQAFAPGWVESEWEAEFLPKRIQDALNLGRWSLALGLAILGGEHDVNKLTDLIFFARHRELRGRRIRPNEKGLAREWLSIRDSLVKPALNRASSSKQASPAARPSA